uniref:Insulin-like n=1 Tax=Diabrotica virgifera virgifera TaxID=50390 RepID=A0A6P7FBN3_DIAVI
MQFKYIFLLCALVFSFYYVNGQVFHEKICGARLTSLINLICRGRSYGLRSKRGIHGECCYNRCSVDMISDYYCIEK